MLTQDMKRVVEEQRLGFVATVGPDGTPNVSPKGTFVVLDDKTIAFGHVRSPSTVRNLKTNPQVEINFVDPFVRKGYRFAGTARCRNDIGHQSTATHYSRLRQRSERNRNETIMDDVVS